MLSFIGILLLRPHNFRSGVAGLGSHFHDVHGGGLDLSKDDDLRVCPSSFLLAIVASVEPPSTPEEMQASKAHIDRIMANLQNRLKCLDESGMNRRDENEREKKKTNIQFFGVLVPLQNMFPRKLSPSLLY